MNLMNYFIELYRKKIFIFASILFFICLAATIYLFVPRYYRSVTVMIPADSLGYDNLPILYKGGLRRGKSPKSDIMMFVLQSHAVSKEVAKKLQEKITKELYPDFWDKKSKKWKMKKEKLPPPEELAQGLKEKLVRFRAYKPPYVELQVVTKDPQLSLDISKAYIEELHNEFEKTKFGSSSPKLGFINKKIKQQKQALFHVKKRLRRYHNAEKKMYYTFQDPEFQEMFSDETDADPTVRIPKEDYLFYLEQQQKIVRDILFGLQREARIIRLEFDRKKINFDLVDAPVKPRRAFYPEIKVFLVGGALLGLFFSFLVVLFQMYRKTVFAKNDN